ncbi:helix-turn-helix domain-containing protein [Microcoleus sp. MON1_C1]|uniref:helix-turn-helix domain-containing protein n=1 Tax=Microcoleus sp. MON1_C1 TaxID=2818827 RepID=UPI002FD03948
MYHRKSKTPAEVIRLNPQGWYVEKIAAHVNWTSQTVREVLHKWEKSGLEGLPLHSCKVSRPLTYNGELILQPRQRWTRLATVRAAGYAPTV